MRRGQGRLAPPEPRAVHSHDLSRPDIWPSRHRASAAGQLWLSVVQNLLPIVIEWWPLERVHPYPGNPRVITEAAVEKVATSIKEFGWRQPIVVDEAGVVIVGHTRLRAALPLGQTSVPVHVAVGLDPARVRAYRLADNRTAEETAWDLDGLAAELQGLQADGFALDLTGFDADELARALSPEPADEPPPGRSLLERFGVAPFSVLSAREGWWQDRKRAWLALGIQSELGRGAAPGGSPRPLDRAKRRGRRSRGTGAT